MTDTAVGAPCALSILSLTINDREVLPDHSIRSVIYDAFETAALEYFEGHARQIGAKYHGKTLELQIAPAAIKANAWSLHIDDCDEGPFKSQLYWPRDDNNDQGHVHAAISDRVDEALHDAGIDDFFDPGDLKIVVRADISTTSAHQKMTMAATRSAICT